MVFADLESILKRQQQQQQTAEGEDLNSRKVALRKPCAAAFYFVCTFDSSRKFYWEAMGEHCAQEMIVELNRLAEKCIAEMREKRQNGHD